MRKYPRSKAVTWVKKGAAILFALEAGAFAGLYYVYHRMNTDRDFRYYMKNNYNFGLEAFYTVGEYMNNKNHTRQLDQAVWRKQFESQQAGSEERQQ